MQKRLLVARDRIILHLMRYSSREIQDYMVPLEITQDGIADAIGIGRNNLPREMKKLLQEKAVESKKVRVSGFRNKKNVYYLTEKGMKRANRLLAWGKILTVNVVDFDGNTVRMRLEDVAHKYGIDPITAIIHLNTDLSLHLEEIMDEEVSGFQMMDHIRRLKGNFIRRREVSKIREWRKGDARILLVEGEDCVGRSTVVHQWVKEYGKKDNILWLNLNPFVSIVGVALEISEYLSKLGRYRLKKYLRASLNDVESGISWENVLMILRRDLKNDIFIFDDVNSADDEIKGFIREILKLTNRISEFRVVLIGKNLGGLVPEEREKMAESIKVGPMDKEDSVRFLTSMGWSREAAEKAYERFGGYPCILELVANCEEDLESCDDPVEKIIEDMSDEEIRAVKLASTFSLHFTVDFLLENDVDDWAIKSLINKTVFWDMGSYIKLHPMVRERILKRMSKRERRKNHIIVAEYFESVREELKAVYHYNLAGDYVKAVHLLYSSFKKFLPYMGVYCMEDIAFNILVNEKDMGPSDLGKLRIVLGEIHQRSGEWKKAADDFREARELTLGVDYDLHIYASVKLAEILAKMGELDEALEIAQGVLKYEDKVKSVETIGRLYYVLSIISINKKDHKSAKRYLNRVVHLGKITSNYELLGYGHRGLGILNREENNCEEAMHHFKESKRYFELVKNYKEIEKSLADIGLVCYKRDNNKAEEYFKEALKIARRVGDLWDIALIKLYLGNVYISKGSYEQAMKHLADSMKILESLGSKDILPYVYASYGVALEKSGDSAEGAAYVTKALKISEEKGIREFVEELLGEEKSKAEAFLVADKG